jgi:hypothetical protein
MKIKRLPGYLALIISIILIGLSACDKEKTEFPITNDLRVLRVNLDGNRIESGIMNTSVIPELEFVFSHALNKSGFENALVISPDVEMAFSYDASGSIVTISFPTPLVYEASYTISLATGSYGANGESSLEDFIFNLTTAAFEPPAITLSSSVNKFFEGETISVTATLARTIIEEVSLDLVFAGIAESGGVDYTISSSSIVINPGNISASIDLTSVVDADIEGEESIEITIENLVNAVEEQAQLLKIGLGDQPPAIELKGVMELDNYISGTDGRVRAVHLRVLEDIPNLGIYGVEIASNGADPDPGAIEYTFPDMETASAGDDILILRDADELDAQTYFGECYADFKVYLSDQMTHNGNDVIVLYNSGVAIETYGVAGVDGTGEVWEYTDSWAYKMNDEWIYAGVACVESSGMETNATSACKYPFCSPLQLQGVSALLWDGSGTNGGKMVHLRANRAIADISIYGIGVANNGGGTDGIEYNFPLMAINEGDQILVSREPGTIASYFGGCYDGFDHVFQADAMTQNGDDAIELFNGMDVVETYGDANVDGTDQIWEYTGAWGYKIGGWTYSSIDCAAGSTSTETSACPYPFCE